MRVLDQHGAGAEHVHGTARAVPNSSTGSRLGPGVAGEARFWSRFHRGSKGRTCVGATNSSGAPAPAEVGKWQYEYSPGSTTGCQQARPGKRSRASPGLDSRRTWWGHEVAWGSSAGGWHDSKVSGSRGKGGQVHRWIARCRLLSESAGRRCFHPYERWSRSRLRDPRAWRRSR